MASAEEQQRLLVSYRSGDVWSPHIEAGEALQSVAMHFAECIRDEAVPISDGEMGLRVVRLLESATRSIRAQGGRVVLTNGGYDARANRSDQLSTHSSRRPTRPERQPILVR